MITLLPGTVISNKELCNIFKCSHQGGMRRSHKMNCLVLVSDYTKGIYEDRWTKDGIFLYTGMGLKGNQSLDFMQNKTLAESPKKNIDLYLFEVFSPGQYQLQGKVYLASNPYQENQYDMDNHIRSVWIFPLRLLERKEPLAIPEETYSVNKKRKEKNARMLSFQALKQRLENYNPEPSMRIIQSTQLDRNPHISEYAKMRANGSCELCNKNAPFNDSNGIPFLETHHIKWLSQGGLDSIENTVALCPNCHRKMHILNHRSDIDKLNNINKNLS